MKNQMNLIDITKTKKKKKCRQIVSFDAEVLTKNDAEKLLSKPKKEKKIKRKKMKHQEKSEQIRKEAENEILMDNGKHQHKNYNLSTEREENKSITVKKKRKKLEISTNEKESDDISGISKEVETNKSKKKKGLMQSQEDVDSKTSTDNSTSNEGESKRAQKRKKHAKLLEEKRSKSEEIAKQSALNYLSKWKHSQDYWKFEKLKQIWLQQNLFNRDKIPDEFWPIVIEYFHGSKGLSRKNALTDALKIIEKENNPESEENENYLATLQRARDIVQNLQE